MVCRALDVMKLTVQPDIGVPVLDCLKNDSLSVFNSPEYVIFPGFCDVHVHFREPGFSYKETIYTGSASAARGGYTAVCTMPNLNPVPDSAEHLNTELEIIDETALINVYPYAAISVGERGEELAELAAMAGKAVAFSDDGRGVQSREMMREAMFRVKSLGKIIAAHCEDNSLLNGGYIHDGEYARAHGHLGICSESEWRQIERDLELVRDTGAAYHVCHVSTKESVALLRAAKADGLDVTCETAPHYITMIDNDLQEDGRFKMNPPLRARADREALIEGICDGTIDMIATDHAPHSAEEKSRGLEKSAFGVVGLETAFPVLYTKLVLPGVITLEKLVELLTVNPRRRFNIPLGVDFSVWDLNKVYKVDPSKFKTMGRATPFSGWQVHGRCMATVCGGQLVWREDI